MSRALIYKNMNKKIIILLLIIFLAFFFRFWQLDLIPPGLWPDEAMNGNDAVETLKSGNFKLFYPDNNGREGLFMWIISLSFYFFGINMWSLKFSSALLGSLTVLGMFFLTKEVFLIFKKEDKTAPLVASFLLATSFWHLNFSRIAFRAIMSPFCLLFSFYFLLRGFRTKKIWNFILSGIFFGIGFHTYISFRMAPLLFLAFLTPLFFQYLKNKSLNKYIAFVSLYLISIFIVALPIGIYFLNNPGDFMGRTSQVSIFDSENPLLFGAKSLISHLAMFNFYGDPNWRHNFSTSPMLPFSLGLLFLVGVIASLKGFFISFRNKDYSLLAVYSLIFSWFFVMLLPGILTSEGIPHALRVLNVIPVVYLLVTIGFFWVYKKLKENLKEEKKIKILNILTIFFLFTVGFSEINKYFYNWAEREEVRHSFTENYVEIGTYLNSLPNDVKKYVMINEPGKFLHGISISAQTPMFIEKTKYGETRAEYIRFEEIEKINPKEHSIVIPIYPEKSIEELERIFENGIVKLENNVLIFEIK